MKHSMTFDIFKIAVPLAAAFTLLIACSDTHPAAAAKAKPAANHTSAAATTAKATSPSPTPTATPAASPTTSTATGPATKAPAMKVDLPSNLLSKAKVPLIEALIKARAKVPGGQPVSEALEQENGKLIYTFDLVAPGTSGVTEVNVDALNGSVLGVQHETASTEKHEKNENAAGGQH